eukprot:CAMPEP_0172900748 /NCGR_PEP_ID=MMETSP1075-20121228/164743_2 /TAXON_ID=2916 /ORGANISM="Ceratium fusus, Strain PA161109" /LENGTH=72 /DNA_ID=CAMNT_0013756997 /DNA_START=152 /DNA_END=367 /DNA_ORIENTATION=-
MQTPWGCVEHAINIQEDNAQRHLGSREFTKIPGEGLGMHSCSTCTERQQSSLEVASFDETSRLEPGLLAQRP